METKPICIRGSDWEVELLVLQVEGREWLSASQVATKLLGWNLSSLRRELNQRDWDKLLVKDRCILLKLAEHGALGDSLPEKKGSIGHARSANLIALETLADLLAALQPKWIEGHEAVRYALIGNNFSETVVLPDSTNENDLVHSDNDEDEEEDEEENSDSEWENEDPSVPVVVKKRRLYNYSLPVERHSIQLRTQVQEFETFMTLPIVMKRQSARVESSTVANACKCAFRFLGYCFYEHHIQWPNLDEFKDLERLEQYFDWLLHQRNVQPQTIESYLNTAINVLKFLHRDEAAPNQQYKDIANVETMRQVRRQVRGLVKFAPPTHEQLARMQKWLPWDQIVKTLSELEKDYQASPVRSTERARNLMEYLMVGLYVYFPPVRAGPIRQLAINQSIIKVNGKWHLDLRKYKTFKIYGPLISEIHADLVGPFESYLSVYRPMLLNKGIEEPPHSYVFINRSGRPFTSSAWTSALQSIFRRKTGQTIGATLLRDSFVTYVYSQDVGEGLKESIALHMGHRVDTAKQVYDRRTSTERRLAGISYASDLVQQILHVEPQSVAPEPEDTYVEPHSPPPEPEEMEYDGAEYDNGGEYIPDEEYEPPLQPFEDTDINEEEQPGLNLVDDEYIEARKGMDSGDAEYSIASNVKQEEGPVDDVTYTIEYGRNKRRRKASQRWWKRTEISTSYYWEGVDMLS